MWTFEEIYNGALKGVNDVDSPGVYKVIAPAGFQIKFRNQTDATKDTRNIKDTDMLKARWKRIQSSSVAEEDRVIYIGQTTTTLRKRLTEFANYGYGKATNHRGGYPLWQIPNNKKLLVEIEPHDDPHARETELLDKYIDICGTEPIANIATGYGSRYKHRRKTDTYELRK